MFISFNRTLSSEFYTYIRNRVNSLKNLQAVVTSDTVIKGLEMPVNSFLKRPAIVVKSGVPLKDALEKMKAAGAEFLVIQDECNAVQGVISLHDLIKLMMENGKHE